MSSDHLVVDLGDHDVAVGDEVALRARLRRACVRAMTSPFVTVVELPAGSASTLPLVS